MSEQIPSVGRIVHYVLDAGPYKGQHRPAIIVRVWQDPPTPGAAVQLQVFTDSDAESTYNDQLPPVMWKTSVMQDPTGEKQHTWHWPERV